ncbi:unnamed protein product, partial [Thlaspi arvense]
VEKKSVKLSSKNTTHVEITSQALASTPLAKNLKLCGKKGAFPSRKSDGDLAKDLSDISDAEVARYINKKKEFLLNKIAWEMMNPDYQKEKQRKPTTVKKTAPSKKTSAVRTNSTKSNAESENNKKRLSSYINYDLLDKLFDDENSPKRAKLEKPVTVDDQLENSQQSSKECVLKPQSSEEEEELNWNEDYSNEDAYGGVEELYGNEDLEFEDKDEGEDNEDIIW